MYLGMQEAAEGREAVLSMLNRPCVLLLLNRSSSTQGSPPQPSTTCRHPSTSSQALLTGEGPRRVCGSAYVQQSVCVFIRDVCVCVRVSE